MKMKKPTLWQGLHLVLVAAWALSSCDWPGLPPTPRVRNISSDQLQRFAALEPGKATREDVVAIFGEPSSERRSTADTDAHRQCDTVMLYRGPESTFLHVNLDRGWLGKYSLYVGPGRSFRVFHKPPLPSAPPPEAAQSITKEQVQKLATLVPTQATREDVIAILGQPRFEADGNLERQRVRGFPHADATGVPWLRQLRGWDLTMMYMGGTVPGKEMRTLAVLLDKERFVGYVWRDGSAGVLPAARLSDVRALLDGGPSRADLAAKLGPPVAMYSLLGALSRERAIYVSHWFHAPGELSEAATGLRIELLAINCFVDHQGRVSSWHVAPRFVWIAADLRVQGASAYVTQLPDAIRKAEEEYQAYLASVVAGSERVTQGGQAARVQAVLSRLLKAASAEVEPPGEVIILERPEVNALIGLEHRRTRLILFTGLLRTLQTEDQLAAVIAHELAHPASLHLVIPIGYLLKSMPEGLRAQMYRWSQCMEHEADARALEMMHRAGFRLSAMNEVLRILRDSQPTVNSPVAGSTHPVHELRRRFVDWYVKYRFTRGAP